MKRKKSKAFAMNFHWLNDRQTQGQFNIIWAAGSTNLADLLTKALSAKDHLAIRCHYVQDTR